ncbi:MAG: hypothetical protein C5B58_10075 [Acidobacteria bacterium]|nr:MAG: hypothetical protein C5B58_10075 [Acidobacteriota bacterium]
MEAQISSPEQYLSEILDAIQRRKLAVFCGAGISRASGIPIVYDIQVYLMQRLGAPQEDIDLLLSSSLPFEAFMQALNATRSITPLLEIFARGEPNTNHHLLAGLAKAGLLRTICTTNFDLLIEGALESAGLQQDRDFSRFSQRNHFDQIDWSPLVLRLLKPHGSIEQPEDIAVTLQRVAGKVWTQGTRSVIERLFSTGEHDAILVLGYSCSDLFDLSPQIESLDGPQKRVLLVDHDTGDPSTEELSHKTLKNPFRRWKQGRRLKVNTDWLINRIREGCLPALNPSQKLPQPDWHSIVDAWIPDNRVASGRAEGQYIVGSIFVEISYFDRARRYFEDALQQADTDELRGRCHVGLALVSDRLADPKAAMSHAEAAVELGTRIGDPQLVRTAKSAIGAALITRSDFKTAERWIMEGAPSEEEFASAPVAAVSALNNLGLVRLGLSQFEAAIAAFKRSATISEGIGDKRNEGNAWANIGNVHTTRGDLRAAMEAHEHALDIYRSIGDRRGETTELNHLGIAAKNLGDYLKALDLSNASLQLAQQMGDAQGMMFAHASLAVVFRCLTQHQEALGHSDQALALSDQVEDVKSKSGLLLNLVEVYLQLGEPERAGDCLERGMALANQFGDEALITSYLGAEANLYSARGDLQKAYELQAEVLERAEKAGLKKVMALALQNIGAIMSDIGEYEKALEGSKYAAQIAHEIGDERTLASILINIGLIYKRVGDFDAAIEMYEQSLATARRLGDRDMEGTCLGNLAIVYGKVGRTDDMLETAQRALEIARQTGDRVGAGKYLGTIGNAYGAMNDGERAIEFYKQSLTLFRTAGARRDEAMMLDNIASTLANQGRYRESLEWFEQAREVAVQTYGAGEKFMTALENKIGFAQAAAAERPVPGKAERAKGKPAMKKGSKERR